MHDLIDLYKKFYNDYCHYPYNYYCIKNYNECHYPYNYYCIKNYDECICIIGKYSEFCEKSNYISEKIAESYFNKVFLFTTKSYYVKH